jgi:hypothetical protein
MLLFSFVITILRCFLGSRGWRELESGSEWACSRQASAPPAQNLRGKTVPKQNPHS